MQLSRQALLLFTLNFLDAVMTIYWVHNGFATEGNQLMAGLLHIGYAPFLVVKLAVGATAAFVLWHWGNFRLAKLGLGFALAAYISLMGIHFITGLSALGFISEAVVNDFSAWSNALLAFLF
jgi:hypothetical protein